MRLNCINFSVFTWAIKQYALHFACFFNWECQHTIALQRRQRHQPQWIFPSEPRVGALKILEVVNIYLFLEYHYDSVFAQLYVQHIGLEIEFAERSMLNIIP